jgi:hypothetical protein
MMYFCMPRGKATSKLGAPEQALASRWFLSLLICLFVKSSQVKSILTPTASLESTHSIGFLLHVGCLLFMK